jgi:hypothetical protein
VSSHARLWGRYRRFVARDAAKNPAGPFIDPEDYRAYIDTAADRPQFWAARKLQKLPLQFKSVLPLNSGPLRAQSRGDLRHFFAGHDKGHNNH